MPELNPDDPFDSVIIDMIQMSRKKRNDYAADSDIFSNFRDTANDLGLAGFGPIESCQVLLLTKVARLKSLRLNGRMDNPSNESVLDTYLDLAVYATILLALVKEEEKNSRETKINKWNQQRVDIAEANLNAVKEWRATNADSSTTEETPRPRPDNVQFRGSVAPGKNLQEEFLRNLYRSGAVTPRAFDSLMAELRSRSANDTPAKDNDEEDVPPVSLDLWG